MSLDLHTYELTYSTGNHFSFGKNWQNFLNSIDNLRINKSKISLSEFLGGEKNIKGKSFIDFGSGSGLFSLAAYLLGASRIVSVDIDNASLECTETLRSNYGRPTNWSITKGSALDKQFIKSLGKFDIVYSWGVLHHTGDMYQALNNVSSLIAPRGIFYVSIYNKTTSWLQGGPSWQWLRIKAIYNSSNSVIKQLMLSCYTLVQIIGLICIARINPVSYIYNYKNNRGMSWKHDLIDWLGGYPYEYATPDEIIKHLKILHLSCIKVVPTKNTGCNEFLFVR
ncbi:MAG: Methyltransferase family protein [Candidatus Amesbacteria bacterium GW2011_GWB1_47_19]|nr:MAG: Methyltransferase family protein [Candidatus Amesbacteria bacterium GW2011_GWA1_44_24]KKU31722.1 MAG: Methyltransferase type 12 [Candidatus Amesbacteria bacterium GW2011_GWC1_46_24]KKU67635.1 MAG: Methyltransferase family protein [Candidatus Amesbacteria bacterium GW2011_GWB1_47_19]OGD06485.1 MAG: hypothetical protein A2379_02485 [Candidatus Amesbacteria bacterium RIFOXYB1_FULL_47_13]HBC72888.1 class I SAM-dependent methyltransferase [Candidatus Amesbacteria bacterium]